MGKSVLILSLVAALLGALYLARPAVRSVQAQQTESSGSSIKIDNFSFGPRELKVQAGTTVIWTNRDDIPHNIVSTEKLFKSKPLDTDEKFSYTFSKTGSYSYFCGLHPKMTGKIIVQ